MEFPWRRLQPRQTDSSEAMEVHREWRIRYGMAVPHVEEAEESLDQTVSTMTTAVERLNLHGTSARQRLTVSTHDQNTSSNSAPPPPMSSRAEASRANSSALRVADRGALGFDAPSEAFSDVVAFNMVAFNVAVLYVVAFHAVGALRPLGLALPVGVEITPECILTVKI